MEDLNKNTKTEKPIVIKSDLKKEPTEDSAINAPKVPPKRIRVRTKTKPALKSDPVAAVETTAIIVAEPKPKEKVNKKGKKNDTEIVGKKTPKKEKAETKPMVKKKPAGDLKEEKPDSVKVIKRKVKKAGEKVDKLKKKVKKAKKKEVKPSKIKALKEKLKKALDKLKISTKKVEKAAK